MRRPRRGGDSLLVNFLYYNPIGHAVEALRYCLGYHRADPGLRVSVLLTSGTAVELARFCPFVHRAYPVDFGLGDDAPDPARALAGVPCDWDYVVDMPRSRNSEELVSVPNLGRFYAAAAEHFRAAHRGIAGSEPPAYSPHGQLRLSLPPRSRARARRRLGGHGVRIALLPAGSSAQRSMYPSAASWTAIVRGLAAAYPDACFCLIAKLQRDGRTTTQITAAELAEIAAACPQVVDYVDRPLADQLAAVEACRLFVSPHTGFGFAALAVGTPWLTLSGGPWPEYLFNGVPFYSILPDPSRWPGFTGSEPLPVVAADEDGQGERALSMSWARIQHDLPELVEAARVLIEGDLPYERALELHFPRMAGAHPRGRPALASLDSIHELYV
jgi:hypothetical protein